LRFPGLLTPSVPIPFGPFRCRLPRLVRRMELLPVFRRETFILTVRFTLQIISTLRFRRSTVITIYRLTIPPSPPSTRHLSPPRVRSTITYVCFSQPRTSPPHLSYTLTSNVLSLKSRSSPLSPANVKLGQCRLLTSAITTKILTLRTSYPALYALQLPLQSTAFAYIRQPLRPSRTRLQTHLVRQPADILQGTFATHRTT
jgi:hypothetical protein